MRLIDESKGSVYCLRVTINSDIAGLKSLIPREASSGGTLDLIPHRRLVRRGGEAPGDPALGFGTPGNSALGPNFSGERAGRPRNRISVEGGPEGPGQGNRKVITFVNFWAEKQSIQYSGAMNVRFLKKLTLSMKNSFSRFSLKSAAEKLDNFSTCAKQFHYVIIIVRGMCPNAYLL